MTQEELGIQILQNCRNELYCLFPALDGAFASLSYSPGKQTDTIVTDGDSIFFPPSFLCRYYGRNPAAVRRGYLHMLLHCLFGHPFRERDGLWDLACDLAVEKVIEREQVPRLELRSSIRDDCLSKIRDSDISAGKIHGMLSSGCFPYPIGEMAAAFRFDDHRIWTKACNADKWERIFAYTRQNQGNRNPGTKGGSASERITPAQKNRLACRDYLHQFMQTREETDLDTARGWEDLSQILKSYEALDAAITADLVQQYLQKPEIARDFAAYYQLYRKYGTDYGIPDVLNGEMDSRKVEMAKGGSFEERFTVVHLVLDYLSNDFACYGAMDANVTLLHEVVKIYKDVGGSLERFIQNRKHSVTVKRKAQLLSAEESAREEWVLRKLESYDLTLREKHLLDFDAGFDVIRRLFQREVDERRELVGQIGKHLDQACRFLELAFEDGQEMVLFVSSLTQNSQAMDFISRHGSEGYLQHCHLLLYRLREKQLQQACQQMDH